MAIHAEKILSKEGGNPDKPRVLLCAHTGNAASLIGKFNCLQHYYSFCELCKTYIFLGGTTIFSAFSFRIGTEPIGAGDKTLAELRENLSELKLIIIDEMSLVHADLFFKIDARLKEIFRKQNPPVPFGGISIVVVGDLLQIPPVKGGDGNGKISYIFSRPKHPKNINAYNVIMVESQ